MTPQELTRVIELADMPLPELRKHLAGFEVDSEPSQRSADAQFGKWSRGKLIEWILDNEFEIYRDEE